VSLCIRARDISRCDVGTYYKLRRREPCRIPDGPNRAPGRYEVPVSNGAPVCISFPPMEPRMFLANGHTNERNVKLHIIGRQTRIIWESSKGAYAREYGIGLWSISFWHRWASKTQLRHSLASRHLPAMYYTREPCVGLQLAPGAHGHHVQAQSQTEGRQKGR